MILRPGGAIILNTLPKKADGFTLELYKTTGKGGAWKNGNKKCKNKVRADVPEDEAR